MDYVVCALRGRDVAGSRPGSDAAAWRIHILVEERRRDRRSAPPPRAAGSSPSRSTSPASAAPPCSPTPPAPSFAVAQPDEHRGAQVVNEPERLGHERADNPDRDAAKAFYGDVFGWQADTFAIGRRRSSCWRLPGFVGGEPSQPVPRDVVAAGRLGRGAGGWSVDLLGRRHGRDRRPRRSSAARVLDGPHRPPDRARATVADPQGATFSITDDRRMIDGR